MTEPDFTLSDGKGKAWGFTLDGGARAIHQGIVSEDSGAIVMRSQGKQIGDFDEQNDWKAGHGHERLSDTPNGFYDAINAWTVNKNLLHSGLLWQIADGLRKNDTYMPGGTSGASVKWKKLYPGCGSGYYISTVFAASQSYSVDKVGFWLRRIGTPADLTFEFCADSAGVPGTVLKTATISASTVADIVSFLHEFDIPTTQAVVATTIYHLKLRAAVTDRADNCWEVATDKGGAVSGKVSGDGGANWVVWPYGLFYRVVDADVNRRIWTWRYNGLVYAVSRNTDGTTGKLWVNGDRGKATSATSTTLTNTNKSAVWVASNWIDASVKIIRGTGRGQVRTITANTTTQITVAAWDTTPDTTSEYIIYATRTFIEIAGHGLTAVSGKPITINGIVYFPQDSGAVIRRMRYNLAATPPAHEFAADGTNEGAFLQTANDPAVGPVVWRGLGGNVARSPQKAWGTALVFTAVTLGGDPEYAGINGMAASDGGKLAVVKDDYGATITGLTPTSEMWDLQSTPSALNGRAIIYMGQTLYFARGHSVMRVYGGSADDIGIAWRGTDLPEERQGVFSSFETAEGWLFAAVDGGNSKKSSVRLYDGLNWHEIMEGFVAGNTCRIRDISWQPMEDTYYRLWIDIGTDLVFIDFPPFTNVPIKANNSRYQHEGVVISSTIDMGSAARLPKLIKSLAAITQNLGDNIYIGVDIQIDDQIGTNNWTPFLPFRVSPQDEVKISVGALYQFRYRLRMNTDTNTVPVIVKAITPNGFARTPFKLKWDVRVLAGELTYGSRPDDPGKMIRWLTQAARSTGRIRMRSTKYPELDNFFVIVTPPSVIPERPAVNDAPETASISLSIFEE